ncbi:MAG: hypothetical protein ACLQVD_04520 [Capsulimonadaceae bacterium]
MTNETGLPPQMASALSRARSGAGWFNAIAAFSLVNAVIGMVGANIQFIVGLGLCEIFDTVGQQFGATGKGIAFVGDLLVAGFWVFIANQAKKGLRWPFIVGMILYLLDALLFLAFKDFISAAFHAYVLFRLFAGFQAAGEFTSMRAQQPPLGAGSQGAWYGVGQPPAQPGAWPPPPAVQQPGYPPATGQQPGSLPPMGLQPGYPPPPVYQQPGSPPPGSVPPPGYPISPGQWPPVVQQADPYAQPGASSQPPRTSLAGESLADGEQ